MIYKRSYVELHFDVGKHKAKTVALTFPSQICYNKQSLFVYFSFIPCLIHWKSTLFKIAFYEKVSQIHPSAVYFSFKIQR